MQSLFIVLLLCAFTTDAQRPLEKYNVDRSQMSTSGVSSGAAMASQLHVAYSSIIMGAGILAGGPYYCAQGTFIDATPCMRDPADVDVTALIGFADQFSVDGDIDNTANMFQSKVFIYNGALDTVVHPGIAYKIEEFYANYGASMKIVTDVVAQHTVPTLDYGNPCDELKSPYLGKCNYHGAYELLQFIYPGITRPNGTVPLLGEFFEYDQTEFFEGLSTPEDASMDTVGYIYVPSGCVSGENVCRLHVVFHGCTQTRELIGVEFAMNAGYNEVGELNNIIVIYPLVISTLNNPMGCWDWWGYTNAQYAVKNGAQPLAISKMIDRLSL